MWSWKHFLRKFLSSWVKTLCFTLIHDAICDRQVCKGDIDAFSLLRRNWIVDLFLDTVLASSFKLYWMRSYVEIYPFIHIDVTFIFRRHWKCGTERCVLLLVWPVCERDVLLELWKQFLACMKKCVYVMMSVRLSVQPAGWPWHKPWHWDFLGRYECHYSQTLHDNSTYWALHVHALFHDLDSFSRSQQCETVELQTD